MSFDLSVAFDGILSGDRKIGFPSQKASSLQKMTFGTIDCTETRAEGALNLGRGEGGRGERLSQDAGFFRDH